MLKSLAIRSCTYRGRASTRACVVLTVGLLSCCLPGCNSGLVAIGAAVSDGGSGDGNAGPVVGELSVPRVASSPARVAFVVSDEEGDAVSVKLRYRVQPANPFVDVTLDPSSAPLSGIPSNQPGAYEVLWDFAADLGGEGFHEGLEVELRVPGGIAPPVLSGVELGNDAPVLLGAQATPAGASELGGNVDVEFVVADSAADTLRVRVEYNDDAAGGFPDESWTLARPAATPLTEPTPDYAIPAFASSSAGSAGIFRWDTAFDLAGFDDEVLVRFTLEDAFGGDVSGLTDAIRIDNNAAPQAELLDGALIASPDELRGITIPFTLFDEEGDDLRVILQWARSGEGFPQLPSDRDQVEAILADPEQREAYQVARELPFSVSGRVVPVDDTHVRLPELASEAATILNASASFVGSELVIRRSSPRPAPLNLPPESLEAPVEAIPTGDGTSCLVLDRASATAGWRLRELEVATGAVLRELSSVAGAEPTAMALERGGEAVVVAEVLGGDWQLRRVLLADGSTQLLDGAAGFAARVQGITSESRVTALLTAGSSLLRVRYDAAGPAEVVELLGGLQEPRDLEIDPRDPDRVILCERAAPGAEAPGRLVAFDLATRLLRPLASTFEGRSGVGFPRPTALALELRGARVLVVTDSDPDDGQRELRCIHYGGDEPGVVTELVAGLPESTKGLSTGVDGLRLLALGRANDLAAGGGVEQHRLVTGYDSGVQVASVDRRFDPALKANALWRCSRPLDALRRSSPEGVDGSLVWDSDEAIGGGEIEFRLTPYDGDAGLALTSNSPKRVGQAIEGPAQSLPAGADTREIVAGDLDGDGLQEILTPGDSGDTLLVYSQVLSGQFESRSTGIGDWTTIEEDSKTFFADLNGDDHLDVVSSRQLFHRTEPGTYEHVGSVGSGSLTLSPLAVAIGDVNGDGRVDFVATHHSSTQVPHGLSLFYMAEDGSYPATPDVVLGKEAPQSIPTGLCICDLNGDARLDLVVARQASNRVVVYYQSPAGAFSRRPDLVLGRSVSTDGATTVRAADLNGDGRLDLVCSNRGGQNLAVFLQTGAGSLNVEPDALPGDLESTPNPWGLALGDLNGDGRIDISVASDTADQVTVFFQGRPGQFPAQQTLLLEGGGGSFGSPGLGMADLDGDGSLDLVVGRDLGNTPTIRLQRSPGWAPPFRNGVTPEVELPPSSTLAVESGDRSATADLDTDGRLDLVVTQANGLAVAYSNPGGRLPAIPQRLLGDEVTTPGPRAVVCADLNGDGLVDIASANEGGDNLTVFFQRTEGGFLAQPDLTLGGATETQRPQCLAAADLSGDGRLDLVSANRGAEDFTVFFQLEGGGFSSRPDLRLGGPDTTPGADFVTAADMDGDGSKDIVCGSQFATPYPIFHQIAPGEFPSEPSALVGDSSILIAAMRPWVEDVNSDGRLDIVIGAIFGGRIHVFLQSDAGSFGQVPSQTLTMPADVLLSLGEVVVGDLNQDGLVDVAASMRRNFGGTVDGVALYAQSSSGSLPTIPTRSWQMDFPGDAPQVLAVDLNGDGRRDLVTSGDGLVRSYLLD